MAPNCRCNSNPDLAASSIRFTISAAAGDDEPSDAEFGEGEAERIRKAIESLFPLATGGRNAGLSANGGRAVRMTATVLHELATQSFGHDSDVARRSLSNEAVLFNQFG